MHLLVIFICIVYYVIVTIIIHTMTGLGYGFSLLLAFIIHMFAQYYFEKNNY